MYLMNSHACRNCRFREGKVAVSDISELRYWFWCSRQEDIINITMGCDVPYHERRIPLHDKALANGFYI